MSFSRRAGLASAPPLQRGSMDGPLRNRLWNAVHALLQRTETSLAAVMRMGGSYGQSPVYEFVERIWVEFRGGAADMFPHVEPVSDLRQWFYAADWNRVYDLLEFIVAEAQDDELEEDCNAALTKENAAYRLVDGRFIELTDEQQLVAIADALAAADPLAKVHDHLRTAVGRLADRPEPDYRNAMKEAICAVETLVRTITGTPGVTLGEGLKLIGSRKLLPVHPSLLKCWGALYGYASDAGIRHGMHDGQPDATLEDAMLLVVSCSAIVTYVISLARKADLKLAG